ncbi:MULTISPECIES: YbaN family protein [unclassified Halomonas]|uniref:YbaN family protein n=1 Tax=unclassified Halomonas TaxID=2609666 RepID=UPI0028837487|nr:MULTISPECIES: YbaN family protein [unclassified Halomonas]MDT0501876.1 YbaN family protein [Halomonas sp. PAR7]MDT0513547.1 YbaN family protein [Halomonas sp. LES1]MDT0592531.1 YbaN family protein [Halomonas sp. PAR8]
MSELKRLVLIAIAGISLVLGIVGMFLPLMPTTCFLLLAVWAASRSSPRLAGWIREHPRLGPAVVAWEGERAIPRHAKWLAGGMLVLSMLVLALTVSLLWLKLALIAGLTLLGAWIVTRPEPAL